MNLHIVRLHGTPQAVEQFLEQSFERVLVRRRIDDENGYALAVLASGRHPGHMAALPEGLTRMQTSPFTDVGAVLGFLEFPFRPQPPLGQDEAWRSEALALVRTRLEEVGVEVMLVEGPDRMATPDTAPGASGTPVGHVVVAVGGSGIRRREGYGIIYIDEVGVMKVVAGGPSAEGPWPLI